MIFRETETVEVDCDRQVAIMLFPEATEWSGSRRQLVDMG